MDETPEKNLSELLKQNGLTESDIEFALKNRILTKEIIEKTREKIFQTEVTARLREEFLHQVIFCDRRTWESWGGGSLPESLRENSEGKVRMKYDAILQLANMNVLYPTDLGLLTIGGSHQKFGFILTEKEPKKILVPDYGPLLIKSDDILKDRRLKF